MSDGVVWLDTEAGEFEGYWKEVDIDHVELLTIKWQGSDVTHLVPSMLYDRIYEEAWLDYKGVL